MDGNQEARERLIFGRCLDVAASLTSPGMIADDVVSDAERLADVCIERMRKAKQRDEDNRPKPRVSDDKHEGQ